MATNFHSSTVQSTLNKGEVQYRERLEDIRMLKLKINDLKRKLHMLKQQVRGREKRGMEKLVKMDANFTLYCSADIQHRRAPERGLPPLLLCSLHTLRLCATNS